MSRAGFADGMLKGMAVASHFKGLYDSTQERRELAGVDEATAQQSTGYTAKDGENLEALAGKGYKIDFDQNANAYTATNESGDKKSIPMQGVTDFLGKRSAGTLSSIDERQARQEAKADIVSRRNPERGMQMHAAIAQGVRTQKVAAREDKQWAKQDKLDGDMEAIDANLSQQFEASLLQEDGSKRAPTSDDYMGMTQNRAFQLAQRGHMAKSGEAMKEYHAQAHIKIQSENEARAAAIGPTVAAIHSGDMAAVAGFYNKFVPSGSKVTRIERTKEGGFAMYRSGMDGKEMEPMMFKSAGEAAALVQTVSNPNALYQYSQGEFTRMLQLRQDARAGESLGLQRENAVANRQERAEVRADKAALRKESIAAALELAKEENGGSLTEAQGRA
ncbi:MAG: hypothetical protein RR584_15355, partial [Comamonas sp.]